MNETALAEAIGVNRKELAALRRRALKEGTDFEKRGGAVVYSADGMAAVARALEVEAPDPEKNGGGAPVEVVLRVTRVPRNPRIVLATDGTTADLRVKVRRNVNFRPGMEVPALPVPGIDGLFEFRGRLPRRPGRW